LKSSRSKSSIEYQNHRLKVKVAQVFRVFVTCYSLANHATNAFAWWH